MTKIKLAKKYIKVFIFSAAFLTLNVACTNRAEKLYNEAYVEFNKGHHRIAADLLLRSAELEKNNYSRNKNRAEAARIIRFEIQDYDRAIRLLRLVILESQDQAQRLAAQEAIAEIELENRLNYSAALEELQKLEPLLSDSKKKEQIRLRIAQTLYLTGQYRRAFEEITSAEKYMTNYEPHFLKLKAEVLLAEKNYLESIAQYEIIRKNHPQFFKDENLFIATSIAFEEAEMFKEALDFLNRNEAEIEDKAYFELRIKRLKERLVNKPLYRGIRK